MNIDRATLRLRAGEFYEAVPSKSLLVLHHTVGGSAASSVRWWNEDPRRVATAYIIERDGAVYETMPPECWAGHLACHDLEMEKRSIGIELASEGALTEDEGVLWAFGTGTGKRLGRADELLAAGRVVRFPGKYRGYEYFDAYDAAQLESAMALVIYLCERFSIPKRIPLEALTPLGDPRPYVHYAGVIHHALVRPDKSDLHPAFPFARLARALGDAAWVAAA
jgi:N-acetyl-anhydromuramyl-L-alanine amidase AmpD